MVSDKNVINGNVCKHDYIQYAMSYHRDFLFLSLYHLKLRGNKNGYTDFSENRTEKLLLNVINVVLGNRIPEYDSL